ncbi:MAG TPA: hypothetical protein VNM48_00030, partial [Chloroflexota bacterium]|nr:hypothetical protein [Chloroflexota bacterium]
QLEHSENPDNPADSTVRHALPTTGAGTEGQKGFPQGEYDVIEPAKAGAVKSRSIEDQLLDQHVGGTDIKALMDDAAKDARLSEKEVLLVGETLQPGAEITHPAANQWRVQQNNRFGHGTTLRAALEQFVLGGTAGPEAAVAQFLKYPKSVQKEIEERDQKAAARLGQTVESSPDYVARQEAIANHEAAKTANPAALNANTDGAERASAIDEAGQKRGEKAGEQAEDKPAAKKSAKKSSKK